MNWNNSKFNKIDDKQNKFMENPGWNQFENRKDSHMVIKLKKNWKSKITKNMEKIYPTSSCYNQNIRNGMQYDLLKSYNIYTM